MADEVYFIRHRGQVTGPFTREQLLAKARAKVVTPVHSISTDQVSWTMAKSFSWIFASGQAPTVATAEPAQPEPLAAAFGTAATEASGDAHGAGVDETASIRGSAILPSASNRPTAQAVYAAEFHEAPYRRIRPVVGIWLMLISIVPFASADFFLGHPFKAIDEAGQKLAIKDYDGVAAALVKLPDAAWRDEEPRAALTALFLKAPRTGEEADVFQQALTKKGLQTKIMTLTAEPRVVPFTITGFVLAYWIVPTAIAAFFLGYSIVPFVIAVFFLGYPIMRESLQQVPGVGTSRELLFWLCLTLGILCSVAGLIHHLVQMHRGWKHVIHWNRTSGMLTSVSSPDSAIGLLFVPFFGRYYWVFRLYGIGDDLNQLIDRGSVQRRPVPSWMAIVTCICLWLSQPVIWIICALLLANSLPREGGATFGILVFLTYLVGLVFMILYLRKIGATCDSLGEAFGGVE